MCVCIVLAYRITISEISTYPRYSSCTWEGKECMGKGLAPRLLTTTGVLKNPLLTSSMCGSGGVGWGGGGVSALTGYTTGSSTVGAGGTLLCCEVVSTDVAALLLLLLLLTQPVNLLLLWTRTKHCIAHKFQICLKASQYSAKSTLILQQLAIR